MFTNTANVFKGCFNGVKSHFEKFGEDFQIATGSTLSFQKSTHTAAMRVLGTIGICATSAGLVFSATAALISNPAVFFTITLVAMSVLNIVICYDIIVMANNKDSWNMSKMWNNCDGTLLEPIWKDLAAIKKH